MLSRQLPVSSRPTFTALPSDPCVPLTPEQEKALWGGDIDGMLIGLLRAASRDDAFMHRLAVPAATPQQPTPQAAGVLEKAHTNVG